MSLQAAQRIIIMSAVLMGSMSVAQAQESSAPTTPQTAAEVEEEDEDETDIPPAPDFIGNATAGYRYSVLGERTSHKFDEYKDMSNGLLLGTEFMYFRPGGYYGEFRAADLAFEDRSAEYTGGRFNGIKYTLYGNTMRHRYSVGARTFYTSGVGDDNLQYSAADYGTVDGDPNNFTISTDVNNWREVEYKKTIDSVGASVLLRRNSPWSVMLSTDYRMIKGVQPIGLASGLNPDFTGNAAGKFGHAIEIPSPVDGTNLMAAAEAGWNTEDYSLILSGGISRYDNKYDYLRFRDPYVTTTNVTQNASLSPDSNAYNFSVKGVAKNLPVRSNLVLSYGRQMIRSEIPLLNAIADSQTGGSPSPAYSTLTLGLSDSTFDGKIDYDKAALIWSAQPLDPLSTSLTFRYLKKKNDSDHITYTHPTSVVAGALESRTNHIFDYDKNDIVLGAGYKLPAKSNVNVNLGRHIVNRHGREDAARTRDHRVDVAFRNSSSDLVSFGVKGEYLTRESHWEETNIGTVPTEAAWVNRYFRRFDAANKDRKGASATVDLTPLDDLSVSLEYGFAEDNYKDVVLGLQKDKRDSYYIDVAYEKIGWFKIFAFYNLDKSRNNGIWRQFSGTGGNADPTSGTNNASNFNWTGEFNDENKYYGATLAVPVIEDKMDVSLGYSFMDNDGRADFELVQGVGPASGIRDIEEYGDYKKDELTAAVSYKFTQNLSSSVAFAQQRLSTNDLAWNIYTPIESGNNDRALGNAQRDVSFDAQVYYATVNYEF